MATKRETILARIATVLTPTSGVSARVYRSRVEPLARNLAPAIVVEPSGDRAEADSPIGVLQWTLSVRVSVIVRGQVPDQLADPIVQDLHARLMADTTLQGLVQDIVPVSVAFEMMDADQPAGVISTDYDVIYRTTRESLA